MYQAYPCPHCSQPLSWSQVNQQWWCRTCEIFIQGGQAPPSAVDNLKSEWKSLWGGAKDRHAVCPKCKAPCNLIQEYNRWYCYHCRKWL